MPKAKLFLIVGAHVLAVIGVLCLLWATRYPILTQELFTADAAKSYEESNAFADSVANENYNILDEIRYQTLYDTDGKNLWHSNNLTSTRSVWEICIPGEN